MSQASAATEDRPAAFADRLAAAVAARSSRVCLGLDPDPARLDSAGHVPAGSSPADLAASAVADHCRELIEQAGAACVAVKPQLACFERLGAAGWRALERTVGAAREAGLLVIADGKRGDVPVSAAAYGQAMVGSTPTPWGPAPGLGADAFTAAPFLGGDSFDVLIEAANGAGAGIFALVRTSNPGAKDLLDLPAPHAPLHERLAEMVAERGPRLAGEAGGSGISGLGAVVGATEPRYLGRLRELMSEAVFLLPGVGAQGGTPQDLGPAFSDHPASALVAASRSIAAADDPSDAAERLRDAVNAVAPPL